MKDFKFKLSKVATVLSVVAILLALGGGGWTIYRIVKIGFPDFTTGLQHVVMILVCVLLLIVFFGLLIRSFYRINDNDIVLRFGIIKSTYKIEEITCIHLFTKTNKLVVYFKNDTFAVIVVKPEWHNEFIKSLLAKNEKIRYDVSYSEKDDDAEGPDRQ